MKSVLAWHFTGDKLRNGEPIPKQGEWLEFDGDPIMCSQGLHASRHPYDALKYAPGAALHRVRLGGYILEGDNKLVATQRKIIWTIPPEIMQPLMWDFARYCARSVLHLWDAPDVAKQYLATGDESLRDAANSAANSAAYSAAYFAAYSAANSAAYSAAYFAAYSAAYSAAYFAAYSAANSAAYSAAYFAAKLDQRKYLLAAIKETHKKSIK